MILFISDFCIFWSLIHDSYQFLTPKKWPEQITKRHLYKEIEILLNSVGTMHCLLL